MNDGGTYIYNVCCWIELIVDVLVCSSFIAGRPSSISSNINILHLQLYHHPYPSSPSNYLLPCFQSLNLPPYPSPIRYLYLPYPEFQSSQIPPHPLPHTNININPFNFLKRSSSHRSNQEHRPPSPASPALSPSSGWLGRSANSNSDHAHNYAHNNNSRQSLDAPSMPPNSSSSSSTSSSTNPVNSAPSLSTLGRSTSSSHSNHSTNSSTSNSTSVTSNIRQDPSGGAYVANPAMNGRRGVAGITSATVKTKQSIFDRPNPDQAFDLVEIIGKGSFGVVHRAWVIFTPPPLEMFLAPQISRLTLVFQYRKINRKTSSNQGKESNSDSMPKEQQLIARMP